MASTCTTMLVVTATSFRQCGTWLRRPTQQNTISLTSIAASPSCRHGFAWLLCLLLMVAARRLLVAVVMAEWRRLLLVAVVMAAWRRLLLVAVVMAAWRRLLLAGLAQCQLGIPIWVVLVAGLLRALLVPWLRRLAFLLPSLSHTFRRWLLPRAVVGAVLLLLAAVVVTEVPIGRSRSSLLP